MIFTNVVSFVLAITLLVIGGMSLNQEIGDPLIAQIVVAAGSFIFCLSLLALYGTYTKNEWRRHVSMLLYITLTFLMILLVLFAAIGAFAFKERAKSYVDENWNNKWRESILKVTKCDDDCSGDDACEKACVKDYVLHNARVLGGVLFAIVFFLFVGLVGAIQFLTPQYVLRRIVVLVNIVFFFLAVAIVVVGTKLFLDTQKQSRSAAAIIAFGVFLMCVSLMGCFGARKEGHPTALLWYTVFISLLAIMILVIGCVTMTMDWKSYVMDNKEDMLENGPRWLRSYLDEICTAEAYPDVDARNDCKVKYMIGIYDKNAQAIGLFGVLVTFFLMAGALAAYGVRRSFLKFGEAGLRA